jgi:hypothetical protein
MLALALSETGSWLVTGALLLAGGWIVALNLGNVVRHYGLRREHHSFVPLLGGCLSALALASCPLPGARGLAWIPLVLDPGCAFAGAAFLHAVVVRKALK